MARRIDPTKVIRGIKKRDGQIVDLDPKKIFDAMYAAFVDVASMDGTEVDKAKIEELSSIVLQRIASEGIDIPDVDYINKKNIEIMKEKGYVREANHFKNYMNERKEFRERMKVLKITDSVRDSTDKALLVEGDAKSTLSAWDRQKIEFALRKEADLDSDKARLIAKQTEKTLYHIVKSGINSVTTDMVRMVANCHLIKAGEIGRMKMQQSYGVPARDLEDIIFSKSNENSNISANSPEMVNLTIAEIALKKYALEKIFTKDVAEAHLSGRVHLHDLGYPIRTYCSSHSLEYLKKYGLDLDNLTTKSCSPSHTRTLTGHLNTYLASMQAYYAGALGVGYMNIFYAPLLKSDSEGMNEKEKKEFMLQEAQYLIFSLSQSAFSRGGQTLFIDANIHSGIPKILEEVPAIGPKGKYMIKKEITLDEIIEDMAEEDVKKASFMIAKEEDSGDYYYHAKFEKHGKRKTVELGKMPQKDKEKLIFIKDKELKVINGKVHFIRHYDEITLVDEVKRDAEGNALDPEDGKVVRYKDFKKEAQDFAKAMLEVWNRGDRYGKAFSFPKCDFHINEETFTDPEQREIFDYACEVASNNGSTYFFFDRDSAQLSQCCRLRTNITDMTMIKYPEKLRFCGFQNVSINLPQAAFRAGKGNLEEMIKDIEESMEIAAKAHLQKKEYVNELMKPGGPLWQIGKPAHDGKPYVDLEKSTYIIGLVGLNEAIQYITGKELHEGLHDEDDDERPFVKGLEVAARMNAKAKELSEKYKLKFTLEESPAESTTRRFVRTDLNKYKDAARSVVKGDIEKDEMYYTNSIHFRPDAKNDDGTPLSLTDRIQYQSRFHSLIESGAIIHAFVGEHRPSAKSIANLVEKTYKNTQCAQLVISPEFTYCNSCHKNYAGLKDICPECGKDDIEQMTRIVGYYSVVQGWNKSKKGELKDRRAGVKGYIPEEVSVK